MDTVAIMLQFVGSVMLFTINLSTLSLMTQDDKPGVRVGVGD